MHGIATGTYTFESIAEGTLLTAAMEMKASGWFWPILELFRFSRMADYALQTSLNALKSRIETEALLPGGYHISGPLPAFQVPHLPPDKEHR